MPKDRASGYFDRHALEWAKHYEKGRLALQLFNIVFRRGLKQRWEATMRRALPAGGKTYLDVGCGTGVYSLTLAKAGARHVTGIDSAPAMIELCRQAAQKENLSSHCTFILGSFMETEFSEKFDLVFAMGVFDYLAEPGPFWAKMVSLSRGLVMASFPGHSILREPVRRFRYQRKGLPVYFYHRREVEELGRMAGLAGHELDVFGAGYVLTGRVL